MAHRVGGVLILLGVLCVLAAFCIDANRAPDWMLSCPALLFEILIKHFMLRPKPSLSC